MFKSNVFLRSLALTLSGSLLIALALVVGANQQIESARQNADAIPDAAANYASVSGNLADQASLSEPCEQGQQQDDQLDFDEQGIGTGSPPPTIGPAVQIIEYLPAISTALVQTSIKFVARTVLVPDTPPFGRAEKAAVVLLI